MPNGRAASTLTEGFPETGHKTSVSEPAPPRDVELDPVDLEIEDSFPASDPPSWVLGVPRAREPLSESPSDETSAASPSKPA